MTRGAHLRGEAPVYRRELRDGLAFEYACRMSDGQWFRRLVQPALTGGERKRAWKPTPWPGDVGARRVDARARLPGAEVAC